MARTEKQARGDAWPKERSELLLKQSEEARRHFLQLVLKARESGVPSEYHGQDDAYFEAIAGQLSSRLAGRALDGFACYVRGVIEAFNALDRPRSLVD